MKKTFKRILSLILAATMLLSVMPVVFAYEETDKGLKTKIDEIIKSVSAYEDSGEYSILGGAVAGTAESENEYTSGAFNYTVDSNDEATITGLVFEEVSSELIIPDEIDGYRVVAIEEGALATATAAIQFTVEGDKETVGFVSLHIGKNVMTVGGFVNFMLEEISVDEDNEYFSAVDGVLYNKDRTQIVLIPAKKELDRLEISSTINSYDDMSAILSSFVSGVSVDKVVLTDSFVNSFYEFTMASFEITADGMSSAETLNISSASEYADFYLRFLLTAVKAKEFVVSDNNEYLCADDYGVLYNKNQTVMIKYPIGNTEITLYTLPETVDLSKLHGYYGHSLISLSCSPFMAMTGTPTAYLLINVIMLLVIQGQIEIDFENPTEEDMQAYILLMDMYVQIVDEWFMESAPESLTVHVPDSVMSTFPADQILPSENQDSLIYHNLTGVNACVSSDVALSELTEGTLGYEAKVSDYNALVDAELAELEESSLESLGQFDGTELSEETIDAYNVMAVNYIEVLTRAQPIEKIEFCDGHPVVEPEEPETPDTPDEPEAPVVKDEAVIPAPSTGTINYGDSIILHVDETKIPEGGRVEWSASNDCFEMNVSADGKTCTISPESTGNTTFTVTIYDAEGNAVSTDTQEMTSKAGFWQKIVAFFKGIFNLTKVLPW